jgi:putative DNA primase/helicase
MGLEDFMVDQWFKNGSLQSDKLSDNVLDNLDIVTMEDTEEMYVYEDGIYRDVGELRVRQFLTDKLGDRYSQHIRREVMEVIENKTAKPRSEFGREDHWICLGDCQYNIRTGETKDHHPDDEYLYKVDIDYNSDAACKKFDRFLANHVPVGRIKTIWGMYGHSLHRGYPTQSAFLLWGDTATGKSTTLRVLEHLIGQENVAAQSVRQLKTDNHAAANLYGKQANIVAEAPSPREMKQQEFKALTGGDMIHANPKHRDPFEFYNSATMIFATNDMLDMEELQELNPEYLRRWEPIKFSHQVPEDERIDNYYQAFTEDDEEMQGILYRALEACTRMIEAGSLSFPWEQVEKHYEQLKEQQGDDETEAEMWFG